MLGLAGALAVVGCDPGGPAAFAPRPAALVAGDQGPAPATSVPRRPPQPHPPDPGADALLASMRRALSQALAGEPASGGELRVGIDGVRNQSHAPAAQFTGLRLRLAELLTRSGRGAAGGEAPIRFVIASDEPVGYELLGTAYLVPQGGAEQWELYLTLRRAGEAWVIWRADGPVRMPRRPRPGEPQIIVR